MFRKVIKIDSSKHKAFSVNGFTYEKPFNFTEENIKFDNDTKMISPGFWQREDIEKLIKDKLNYEINGNMLKINDEVIIKKGDFLDTIGMKKTNEWFFINIPNPPNQIILNFSFEGEEAINRPWNYPIPFNKTIELYDDCILWVSGMKNDEKINTPLQNFSVDLEFF